MRAQKCALGTVQVTRPSSAAPHKEQSRLYFFIAFNLFNYEQKGLCWLHQLGRTEGEGGKKAWGSLFSRILSFDLEFVGGRVVNNRGVAICQSTASNCYLD